MIHRPSFTVFISALILTLFTQSSFAQKIRVKKVKGNTAIVESTVPLEEGHIYELPTDIVSQNVDYKHTGLKSRQNLVAIGGSFLTLKGDDYQRNYISLQGRYGWNFTTLGFGVLGQVDSEDLGGGASTRYSGGGFFDYNLVPNRDLRDLVYGAFTLLSFGSQQFPASAGGGSASILEANLGGFLNWFLNSTSTALRVEAFFDLQQVSTTNKQTNITGFGTRALLLYYF